MLVSLAAPRSKFALKSRPLLVLLTPGFELCETPMYCANCGVRTLQPATYGSVSAGMTGPHLQDGVNGAISWLPYSSDLSSDECSVRRRLVPEAASPSSSARPDTLSLLPSVSPVARFHC